MNDIKNKTKIILFASLIAALIFPFSGMDSAYAVSVEQINTKIQNTMNAIDTVKEKLENTRNDTQKYSLEQRLDKLQERLDSQIGKLVELSNPIIEQYQLDAEIRTAEKIQKHNDLYEANTDFATAVDTTKNIMSDPTFINNDKQWNTVLSSLQTIVSIENGNNEIITQTVMSFDETEQLRDLIRNDLKRQEISATIQNNAVALSSTDEITVLSAACDALTDISTPALFQPQFDYNSPNSNGLTNVYTVMYEGASIDSSLTGKCVLEVNLIYEDEDIVPSGESGDLLYDQYRLAEYGRIADIETMYVVSDEATGVGDRMSFVELTLYPTSGGSKNMKAIYDGGSSSWGDTEHNIAQVNPVYTYTGNPVVFVNTWHHALGEIYNSSTFPAYAIQLDLYAGTNSRPGVENIHSTNSYESWYGISPLP